LVVNQIRNESEGQGNQMVKYLAKVKESIKDFLQFGIAHIARSDNY